MQITTDHIKALFKKHNIEHAGYNGFVDFKFDFDNQILSIKLLEYEYARLYGCNGTYYFYTMEDIEKFVLFVQTVGIYL